MVMVKPFCGVGTLPSSSYTFVIVVDIVSGCGFGTTFLSKEERCKDETELGVL